MKLNAMLISNMKALQYLQKKNIMKFRNCLIDKVHELNEFQNAIETWKDDKEKKNQRFGRNI